MAVDNLHLNLNSDLITNTQVAFTLSFCSGYIVNIRLQRIEITSKKHKGMTTILVMNPTSLFMSQRQRKLCNKLCIYL